jgi:GDP-4-dehydro-6-deoxy-D-mannose reductase
VPAFAHQVRAIARGEAPAEIRTGNLDSLRDFTDVRDVVRAYRLLLERGQAGHAYNIASGQLVAAGAILRQLCALAGVAPRLVSDPALYRATDCSVLVSSAKIRQTVGWQPQIELAATLRDLMDSI